MINLFSYNKVNEKDTITIMWEKDNLEVMQWLTYTKRTTQKLENLTIYEWISSLDETGWGKGFRLGFGVASRQLPCANMCAFCARKLEKAVNHQFNKFGSIKDKKVSELVCTGGLLGDPLLLYPSELSKLVSIYTKRFPDVPIRINTAGNMLNTEKQVMELLDILKRSVKKRTKIRMAVSLNQTDEKNYEKIMRPLDRKGAWKRATLFINSCIERLGKDNVYLTFVDYSYLPISVIRKRNWPLIDKEKIVSDCKLLFGINCNNIIFRHYDETVS